MAVGVQKAWSTTAASNATADSNINYAEGQTPASLNNSARADMAAVKGFANQISGAKTTGGSANAQTLTSDSVAAISTAYAAGMIFCVKAGYTNSTTTPTFNVDGVGAKTIKKGGAQAALAAGDITAGGIYWIAYEASGDCFLLLNPDSGPVSAQPLDATLTALAALSYTSGTLIIRETTADTFELVSDALYAHLAGTETLSGAKTFTALATFNLNAASLPTALTGVVAQFGAADGSASGVEVVAFANNPTVIYRRGNTTAASPSALSASEVIGQFQWRGYGATGWSTARATLRCLTLENWTDSAQGTFLSFSTTGAGSTSNSERYRAGSINSPLEMGYLDGGPGSVKTADYTYALTDRGTPTDHNSGSTHAFLVEPVATVAWPDNAILYGTNYGSGVLTIDRGTGVAIINAAGTDADLTVPQYGNYMLRRVPTATATNTWYGRVF